MTKPYALGDQHITYIDVRSPREYRDGAIPMAINLPLFTDEAHEMVGTAYKQKGEATAKILAMEHVSKRLPEIYNIFLDIEKEAAEKGQTLVMYCARGGMRSKSLQGLLQNIGHSVSRLEGGYKAYRHVVLEALQRQAEQSKMIVLHGPTGVGKTQILSGLSAMGRGVIDIEGICQHRGSMLGRIGKPEQPSQKNFEHHLLEALMASEGDYVFVEAESKRLGRNTLPDSFMAAMDRGIHLHIEAPLSFRKKVLIEEYAKDPESTLQIHEILNQFRKTLGNKGVDQLQNSLMAGDLEFVAEVLMLQYYDPKYSHASKNHVMKSTFMVSSIAETVVHLDKWLEELKANG